MSLDFRPEHATVASLSANQLRRRYTVALSLIALLTILSQVGMQLLIADQRHDSRVVNIAGRQRMLSQRITKTSLYIAGADSAEAASRFRAQLEEALTLWVRSHKGLQRGDEELGLPGRNSAEITHLFQQIEPHHQAMVAAATAILHSPGDQAMLKREIQRIRAHEATFLKGMDSIVFRYDWEANEKVELARIIELGLMVVTLLVLALEAIFIFAPATRRIQRDMLELAEREDDLERLFAASPTALLLVDSTGLSILRLNRKAQELLEIPLDDDSPHQLRDFLDPAQAANREFLERIGRGEGINACELLFQGQGGPSREILVSVRGLYFLGQAVAVLGLTDISGIRRAERERQAMELRLGQAQKLESIGRLAAGVAHEINTPAQYVGVNIHFLRESFANFGALIGRCRHSTACQRMRDEDEGHDAHLDYLLEEIPKAIAQSQEGIERISSIVRAMNRFSHPGVATKTLTDINQSILATLEISRNEWKYCATVATDLDPELPPVPVLPAEVNQAVLNLIVNAAHAITERLGEGAADQGRIGISTRREGDWAEICVSDNGCGIPDTIKHKVFDPFFTTKAVGKGTGQGLALAYAAIVEKHGGTLEMTSREGEGTTALIRLPLEPRPTGESNASNHAGG